MLYIRAVSNINTGFKILAGQCCNWRCSNLFALKYFQGKQIVTWRRYIFNIKQSISFFPKTLTPICPNLSPSCNLPSCISKILAASTHILLTVTELNGETGFSNNFAGLDRQPYWLQRINAMSAVRVMIL